MSDGRVFRIAIESLAENARELYARWQRGRRIRMRSTACRALVPGNLCKVTGLIEGPGTEVTPFTQTACAYYLVRLEQRATREDRGFPETVWEPQIQVASTSAFFLVGDDGGKVLVDPTLARSDLPTALVSEHPRLNDENPTFASFLRAHGMLSTMYMGISGDFRFFESTLLAGAMVSVLGTVREDRVATPTGYRDASATRFCMGSTAQRPLYIVPIHA